MLVMEKNLHEMKQYLAMYKILDGDYVDDEAKKIMLAVVTATNEAKILTYEFLKGAVGELDFELKKPDKSNRGNKKLLEYTKSTRSKEDYKLLLELDEIRLNVYEIMGKQTYTIVGRIVVSWYAQSKEDKVFDINIEIPCAYLNLQDAADKSLALIITNDNLERAGLGRIL